MWFDSHCHLQGAPDPGVVLQRARAAGVGRVVCVGTDGASSAEAIEISADPAAGVWATIGLHPHDAARPVAEVESLLAQAGERVVAVGECGLDYHYDHSPRPRQREVFARQVALAKEHQRALVVHTREAWEDTFSILSSEGPPERVVFHCFTGGHDEARRCLGFGAWLSFSGLVTFRNASDVREAAAFCPSERLLVETDSPYLAPVPHRGQANEPAFVPLVGAAVAAARGVEVREVEDGTWKAALEVFALSDSGAPGR